jgi:hypothetical protein
MQVKTRKKAWISLFFFGRNRTFQWVTAKKIKKPSSAQRRVSGCGYKRTHTNLFSFFAASEVDTPALKIV